MDILSSNSVGKQGKDCSKRGRKRTLNIDAGSTNKGSSIPGEILMKEAEISTAQLPLNMSDDEPLSMWFKALKTADARNAEDQSAQRMTEVNGKEKLVNKAAETSIHQLLLNISDDEPLSMWFEALKAADATRALQGRNVEQQGRNVEQQRTTNCSQDIFIQSSQCNDHILPFAKSSLLWKSIESMQVYFQFPQNPHFRTLFSKKDSSREGLAIGLMVDFSNVVKKISTLQADGPKNILEDTLETLCELEDNGFDVNVVRNRVVQLLLLKHRREELEAKAKEDTDQIKDEKVEDLNNYIRLLQEELALALSTKAQKDSIVAHLKSRVNHINDSIRNVDLEFKALVAAPWKVG